MKENGGDEKTLVLLEYREDAEYFLRDLKAEIKGPFTIVSLDDDAGVYLTDRNIDFMNAHDFLPPGEEGALAAAAWERLEGFCGYGDGFLHRECGFLFDEVRYIDSQIDILKVLLDSCIRRVEVLWKIFRELEPAVVYFASSRMTKQKHNRLFFDESFSLSSVILEARFSELAGKVKKRCWPSRYAGPRMLGSDLKRKAQDGRRFLRGLVEERADLGDWKRQFCWARGTDASIKHVARELEGKGLKAVRWDPDKCYHVAPVGPLAGRIFRTAKRRLEFKKNRKSLERAFEKLKDDLRFREAFRWKGVCFYGLVEERLKEAFINNVAHQHGIAKEAELIMRHVSGVLASFYLSTGRPIAQVGKRMKRKIVSVQHGSAGHDCGGLGWGGGNGPARPTSKHFYYSDMAFVDEKLCWGTEAAREMENWRGSANKCALTPYGAPHLKGLKAIRGLADANCLKILYVSNASSNNTYALWNFRAYGNRLNQYRILDSLASERHGHTIMFKGYGSWMRNEVFSVIRRKHRQASLEYVSSKAKLTDLFESVSAVIFDYPTTGLWEACVTKLPVFLFNSTMELLPSAREMLKKRVYYSEDLQEFISMTRSCLRNPEFFPCLENNEFVQGYIEGGTNEELDNIFLRV